jgi:hypothetical protein
MKSTRVVLPRSVMLAIAASVARRRSRSATCA